MRYRNLAVVMGMWLASHGQLAAQTAALPSVTGQPTQSGAGAGVPSDLPVRPAVYGRYLLQPSDTITISYRYSPEYDFTGAVQPDGYVSPPLIGEIRVAGLTLEQAHERILATAKVRLRDPEIFVVLKDFERPSFAVSGEVAKPGRFELRGRTGILEALAIAGGLKNSAKHSDIVLFRRYDDEHVITQIINVKDMQRRATPQTNIELQPGDLLLVPQNRISKIERLLPLASMALYSPFLWR